jgi:predicted transcriptional regulator
MEKEQMEIEIENISSYLEKPTEEDLKGIYCRFFTVFNVNSREELMEYLSEKNVSSKQVCAKVLKRGVGAWICKDCEKDSSCIICNECYEKSKEKHIGHKKFFKSQVSGCCDCGDPDSWDPNGFCSDHKGIITSDEEVNILIKNTFNEQEMHGIYLIFEDLFNLISKVISIFEKTKESSSIEMICEVMGYLEILASTNSALLHIIVSYFKKNFEIETSHSCFILQNDSKKIQESEMINTDNSTNSLHKCNCSFFQNLIRIWDKKFDSRMKIDKILYTFLKSYKFKYLYGLSYLSVYDTIMINDSDHLKSFSVQVMTIEDVAETIVASEEFINNLFQKLYYLTNYYLDEDEESSNKSLETLYKIVFEFYMDINYLSKPKPVKILSRYVNIIKTLIDVIAIIQNRVKFEKATSFKYEGFKEQYLMIEMYLLNLFSLLTTNFDFSIKQNADEILFYLMDKILTKDFSPLEEKEYTFHIPLHRALSMFLNRYSLYQSVNNKIDVFLAIKTNLFNYLTEKSKTNYSLENLLADLTKDVIKFIGFINSLQCKYWVYYGENMLYYHIFYYAYEIFYLSDLTLLKLLLSQDHTSELLNFDYFFKICDVNEKYIKYMNSLIHEQKYIDSTGSGSTQLLFIKNLEIFLKLLRNPYLQIDLLASSFERVISNKVEDTLLKKLLLNDQHSFREFLKMRLIHVILSKGNSIYYSEIIKLLPYYLKEFSHGYQGYNGQQGSIVEELLAEMCDKVMSKNKPILFSLKNDYLKQTDLYFIVDPKSETNAQKYLLEFKKNEISLVNSPDYHTFTFLRIINANFANHFFQNEKNLDICIKTTEFFLNKISNDEINPSLSLVLEFMKLVDIFISISPNNGYLSKYDVKLKQDKFIQILSNNKIIDNNLQNCCQYLLKRIQSLNKDTKLSDSIKTCGTMTELDLRKLKMKEMKEKTKQLFRSKTEMFKSNFHFSEESNKDNQLSSAESQINLNSDKLLNQDISSTHEEDKNNKCHDCIICRNTLKSTEFLSKPYGRIGVFSASSFIYHSKLQTLKKEYEKIFKYKENSINMSNLSSSSLTTEEQHFVKDLMLTYKRTKPEMKKTLRYISCNHYIHFSCYLSLIIKYVVGNSDNSKQFLFICPLCKTMSNTFIPSFDYTNLIKSDQSAGVIKGLTYAELFNYYTEVVSKNSNFGEADLDLFIIKNFKITTLDEGVINSLSNYIEKIISLQMKSSFLLNDFKNKNNQLKYYESMRNFFINSVSLLEILKKDEYDMVLDILKEFILSLRLLIKSNSLDGQIFFSRLLNIQSYWKSDFIVDDNICYNIDSDKVSSLFLENIFLVLVLLEESELNYLNIIFRHFTPLILIQFFTLQVYIQNSFKISRDNFNKYFTKDNFMYILLSPEYENQIKNFLIFYLRKALMLKNIFKDNKKVKDFNNEDSNNLNSEFIYLMQELGMKIEGDFKISDLFKKDENLENSIYPSFWILREDIKELSIKFFEKYRNAKLKLLENSSDGKDI